MMMHGKGWVRKKIKSGRKKKFDRYGIDRS